MTGVLVWAALIAGCWLAGSLLCAAVICAAWRLVDRPAPQPPPAEMPAWHPERAPVPLLPAQRETLAAIEDQLGSGGGRG